MLHQTGPKKHHFTPEAYLGRWTIDYPTKGAKLYKFIRNPKGNIHYTQKTPAQVGYEEHLYKIPDVLDYTDAHIETKILQIVDNSGPKSISRILDKKEISNEEIPIISQFISTMVRRSPKIYKKILDLYRYWDSEILNKLKTLSSQKGYDEFTESRNIKKENKDLIHVISDLILSKDFTKKIKEMKFYLFFSEEGDILTSDRPIVGGEYFLRDIGVRKDISYFLFPISPNAIIIAANNEHSLNIILSKKHLIVASFNKAICHTCDSCVFGNSLDNKEIIERFFGKGKPGNLGIPDERENIHISGVMSKILRNEIEKFI